MPGGEEIKEAVLWEPSGEGRVKCSICAHRCLIADGHKGFCGVRKNVGGKLYSLNYGHVCAANPDPIEKKPLFHFQPGSRSFSVAALGCNFRCRFCQNWQISQAATEGWAGGEAIGPEKLVQAAVDSGCKSMAYTYTEPAVFMELCADCARLARRRALANVFVSNGYMTAEALQFASGWLDGINVDLKSYSDDFYRDFCSARLEPVLEFIRRIAAMDSIWLEVTTLIIPGCNDSEEELAAIASFLAREAGCDVPWHVSRFHPQYRYLDARATPLASLERALEAGRKAGLKHVYPGNVPGLNAEDTCCSRCGAVLISRSGYCIAHNRVRQGKCPDCGEAVAGFRLDGGGST